MLARLVVLGALVASVACHGAMYGPGHFGGGSEERLAYPIDSTSGGPDKTFFRGLSPKNAQGGPMQLKAGGKATLTIGCDQFPFQQGALLARRDWLIAQTSPNSAPVTLVACTRPTASGLAVPSPSPTNVRSLSG